MLRKVLTIIVAFVLTYNCTTVAFAMGDDTDFIQSDVYQKNSNCFIAGTLVLTEDGNKPIEEIQVGDKVLAENPETGEQEYKEVVQVFENETNELVHLTVNGETITTTPTHPFYVPQRGWINAIDLKSGDILVLSNGEYVTVEQVQHEILEAPVKIYNFEVQDFHTYYVGESSVLVHNLGCGNETPVELSSFGNKTEPRGARPQQDFGVDSFSDVVGPETELFPKGASNVNNVPLRGHYHNLPAGTVLLEGLGLIADGIDVFDNSPHRAGNYTIFPTRSMSVDEFNNLYKSLSWYYGGKK